ncbi:MAG: hypothetical protein ABSA11_04690 [Candidatus Bathyarchaeia archaeon]|jgi:hypothetical protein
MRTLVIDVGNLLWTDDGIRIHVINLPKKLFPEIDTRVRLLVLWIDQPIFFMRVSSPKLLDGVCLGLCLDREGYVT